MQMTAFYRLYSRLRDAWLVRWWRLAGTTICNLAGIHLGRSVRFYGLPIISLEPASRITLGDRTVLCSHPRYTALGVARPVILRTLRSGAVIEIGQDVGMSGAVICAAISVRIGNGCLFGADVQITDTDFHPVAAENRRYEKRADRIGAAGIVIEDNVFLGAGVRVLKGVRIGRDAVVGAGTLVVRDVPPGTVFAGVPGKVIRPV
jgi:acetyltransferase-like isoleucine patch superfamily enzyme